ncbi:MAG: AsmA family protein [Candidatus Sedimenticola sp. (ex Thyasira tokunagai)]
MLARYKIIDMEMVMGKLFKILGGLIGLVVLLVVAAMVIVPMVVDPNDYKEEIVAKVQEQTGRTLQIDGDLKLSVFPWLGIEIGELELSNARGFGDKPFAAVNHAAVRVKLMPLFSSQVEVDTIGLEGLQLNLAKNSAGVSNWDDLAKGDSAPESGGDDSKASGGIGAFTIGGININNAQVSWDDRSSGQQLSISNFSLNSGAIAPGRPVALEMGMQLENKAPQVKAEVQMDAQVSIDGRAGELRIEELSLKVDAEGEALAGGAAHAELEAAIVLALDGTVVAVNGLKVTAGELKLAGDLKGVNLSSKPAFSGAVSLAEFNLREWLAAQGMTLPETADPKALTRFSADIGLNAQGSVTKLEKLAVTLDDTKISGSATLRGSAVAFVLDVDAIDADRYLPPAKEGGEKPEATTKASGDEPLMPVETLRQLDIDGKLKIGKLIISKLLAEQLEVSVKARKGKLELGQKVGRFYEGSYQGVTKLDVSGKSPLMNTENHLSNLSAGPLVKDLTGEDRFDGKGKFNAKLSSRGNSVNAIKRSLGGNLDFSFENGAVKGFNLAQSIRDAKAKIGGGSAPQQSQAVPQTDFSELTGSAVIAKGVLTNKDLLAKSPYLRVNGAGQVNLVAETLDYKVKAVVVSTEKGQGGEGLDDLKGVPIPVHLTGPYASPDYSFDFGSVLAGAQKAKVEKRVEEKKQELKQKLESGLKDKFKGLF